MFQGKTLPLVGEADHVTDAGDGFPLEAGGGGQQGTGGSEENAVPAAPAHLRQQVSVQHGGGAAAAGGACVHVLPLPVVQQQSAVLEVLPHIDAVPGEEVPDDGMAQLPQVSGDDQIVVLGLGPRVPEEGSQTIISCRGRSQGCTMWKMFSVKFNAYSSPEARRF